MKKKMICLICIVMVFSFPPNALALTNDEASVKVFVDGYQVSFPDQKAFINNDSRTMVPVRFVSEALRAVVDWNASDERVDITMPQKAVQLWLNQTSYKVDGKAQSMNTAPEITDKGRTIVPLRFVSEGLGFAVHYENGANGGLVFVFSEDVDAEMKDIMVEAITYQDAGGTLPDPDSPAVPKVTDVPDDFPEKAESYPVNKYDNLSIEVMKHYADLVNSTIEYNKETGQFSFILPIAPKGKEWEVGLNYKLIGDNRVRTIFDSEVTGIPSCNIRHSIQLADHDQIEGGSFKFGLKTEGSSLGSAISLYRLCAYNGNVEGFDYSMITMMEEYYK